MTTTTGDTAVLTTAPDALLLGFARALRAAGLAVTPDREAGYLAAVATVGLGDERATYWAGRATLTGGPDDILRYDQVFSAWFTARQEKPRTPAPAQTPPVVQADLLDDEGEGDDGGEDRTEQIHATASSTEVLRQRDVGAMTVDEKALLASMFASLHRPRPVRRATRATPRAAAPSTPGARCAASCATSVSPPTSPGAVAAPAPAGSSCSSTSPAR